MEHQTKKLAVLIDADNSSVNSISPILKYPNRYTAFSVDNVKFLRQQSEDLFLYTWNIRFLDNQSDDVYGCDSQQLSWNKKT